MIKKELSKWFDRGAGYVCRYPNSDCLLFQWNGKPDGVARFYPHVKRYGRNGAEYPSLAALLRAVEIEHAQNA